MAPSAPSPFTLTYWIHKRIDRTNVLDDEENKVKFLKLSPYSNILSFERKLLMDVIQQDGNEIRAEIIRNNYIFTKEKDTNVRFYNYLLHNKQEILGFRDLRWYWMQGEDSSHLGYNKPLEKHMKSGAIWSFFMSGPLTFAMFQYSLPDLSFSRKFAPAFGFGLLMGMNGYFKSYDIW